MKPKGKKCRFMLLVQTWWFALSNELEDRTKGSENPGSKSFFRILIGIGTALRIGGKDRDPNLKIQIPIRSFIVPSHVTWARHCLDIVVCSWKEALPWSLNMMEVRFAFNTFNQMLFWRIEQATFALRINYFKFPGVNTSHSQSRIYGKDLFIYS